ncbi:IS4 family transposase [Marinomonas gallaica]|uniref:IS4 family transposase n=1 Tax=Marinomonas gallaica TaxID=1806667 RepID=UPI003A8EB930
MIYATIRKKHPSKQAPTIREMIRMIASLGGFLGRKSDGEPGIKSLWQGLERCQERLMGAEIIQSLKA